MAVDIESLLEALTEPALIIQRGKVLLANQPAKLILGAVIEGTDVRLAIRHPEALEHILPGKAGSAEITGLGEFGRPWTVFVKELGDEAVLVQLIDRSGALAAERMRVDFVANASHELRTPLSTIIGYTETLADSENAEPAMRASFADVIGGEAKRMLQIIEDLMSLSRIEAERFVAPTKMVDASDLLASAVSNARQPTKKAGCRLAIEMQPNLPLVLGDRPQLLQMLDNLVANAILYGCSGEACDIRISARATGGLVRFTIADKGPGIAREHLHRLTERFYRVDAGRSRNSGGTGLGLSIVKHIVERHRGSIEIHSKVGEGTEVSVAVPAAPETALSQK